MSEFYDPHLYDLKIGPGQRVGDIYWAEAREGTGAILELGCGTGDVLLPLARSGRKAAGIDASPAMLDKFRERIAADPAIVRENVELYEGRMENFSLPRTFQQIIIPNDGIAHLLDEQSLRDTLINCYKHLEVGGKLILDISPFDVQYMGRFVGSDRELLRGHGCFPLSDDHDIRIWEQTSYDQVTGVLKATFRYEILDSNDTVTQTYYRKIEIYPRRPSEVTLMLEVVGFKEVWAEFVSKDHLDRWILRGTKGE